MSSDALLSDVFACAHCEGTRLPFVRSSRGRFYRFPPIIGAAGSAPLLFIGINPRVSDSNRGLHESLVADWEAFVQLARNRVKGHEYIGGHGLERHYSLHAEIANALFPGAPFDTVAAVTELHFCASETSVGLPPDSSRCADRYLRSVLDIVSPRVVFAVGKHVERTLLARFRGIAPRVAWSGKFAPVITLPHPAAWGSKRDALVSAIERSRVHLASAESPTGDPRGSA